MSRLGLRSCHLIENGTVHTDPSNPKVLQLLTKDHSLKTLRVQGVRTEIGTKELQQIRGYLEAVFGIKPQLVAAILNDKLKDQLEDLHTQAGELENWAKTAVCSLPLSFESGTSLVTELINSNAQNMRLLQFMRDWETLVNYVKLLRDLTHFRGEHGQEYVEVRSFFNNMLYVENPPEEVLHFVQSWRVLEKERMITDSVRWSELMQAYHTAQQTLTNQIHAWCQEAQKELVELENSLPKRVKDAGVPEAEVDRTIAELQEVLYPARERVERLSPTLAEARAMRTMIMNSRLDLPKKVQEIRARYQTSQPAQPQEIYMNWRNILGQRRITSPDDLKPIIETLQRHIDTELEQHHIVIID